MRFHRPIPTAVALLLLHAALLPAVAGTGDAGTGPQSLASIYAADFVSTAAFGTAMNDLGDVIGTSYTDPGCGPFCLPPLETVVWRNGVRTVLPTVPGLSGITVRGINNQGLIAGLAGFIGTTTHAVVWIPNGSSYTAVDIGNLPGKTISDAVDVDNLGRVVGWSTTSNFPPTGAPFMWTQAGGLVDLSAQGFPVETPLAMSPGGTVLTTGSWYQLGDPASVTPIPGPPPGFFPAGSQPGAINDFGDQARFLVSTSTQNLVYPFRLGHTGTWQQISSIGTGMLSTYGVGSITNTQDITATVLSTGMIAAGPNGLLSPVAGLLSPAYPGSTIGTIGDINASGEILARVFIGNSQRLMRLVPATACSANCIRISKVQMRAKFVQDPADPGHCAPGLNAFNKAQVRVTATDENGIPLQGVLVSGIIMDDYWTNQPVSGTTNALGQVSFSYTGPCGVGAIAFLVDKASFGTRALDRTTGVLTNSVIPQ